MLGNRHLSDVRHAVEATVKGLPPNQRKMGRKLLEAIILDRPVDMGRGAEKVRMTFSEFFDLVFSAFENLHIEWRDKNF